MKLSWNEGIQRRRDGCTECRRKKVKCDLQKPTCSRCTRYPRGCKYESNFITGSTRTSSQVSRPRSPQVVSTAVTIQPPLNPWANLSTHENQFFMHHFGTQTVSVLFPLAPPLFSKTLVSTALNTKHLLHALLAAACSHHARLITDTSENTRRTILKFTNLAISGLRDALNDENEMLKSETAMTAMALCTNDVCNGNPRTWRVHLQGVNRLLSAVFEKKNQPTDNPFARCLFKWFATLDVSAGLSGIHGGCVEDGRYWSLEMTSTGHVDDICGYSIELLPLLARIGILARQKACSTPSIPTSEVEDIETRILAVSNKSAATHTLTSHSDLALQLPHTHQAFVHSALLHLHRRVQNLPKDHPKVRSQISGIINAFNNIPPFSTANILILWPIFSAGCETDDIIERDIIQERMKNMQATGMGNFTRAREALSVYWEANTEVRWDLFFAGSGLELVLF